MAFLRPHSAKNPIPFPLFRADITLLSSAYFLSGPDNLVLGTVGGASTPGSAVEMAPFRNADSQKWLARQNEDGTYTLLLKSGGQKVALDVAGGSLNDESPIQVWSDNQNDAQKWTFHAR